MSRCLGLFADAGSSGPLTYTPPDWPEPPSAFGMLLRLGLATAFVLSLCVGLLWLARRQGARVAAKSGSRLQLVDTLSLGNQSYLYRLRVDDEEFVVGVNRAGLQSLQRMEPTFEATFEALATGEEQPLTSPPRPAA